MNDTKSKLSKLTVRLHWVVGITIITLLSVGVYMKEFEAYALYPIHKSFGVLIFLVVLGRVIWRIKKGWPKPASDYKRIEQILSKITHWILIIGTVAMPVSGMILSGVGGFGFGIFGLSIAPENIDAATGEVTPFNTTISEIFGYGAHEVIGYTMIGAVALHIIGALKHHIVDKDGTLRRMAGADISA